MPSKRFFKCKSCGYTVDVYEGRGLFQQEIKAMYCPNCKTIQNIVIGGIIGDVAPSFRSASGRLCLKCGSENIKIWDMHTCPKCFGEMKDTEKEEFWT